LNIKIVLNGKLKESFYKEGVFEYQKRLLGRVEIVETTNILEYIKNKPNSYKITMEIEGKSLNSVEFANKLSDFKFSMSKLTFLHQEAVLILIEQIYRAYKILNNEPYHK